jgi:hypothetical protein
LEFLVWLEGTWWSGIVRESSWGYPSMITLHSLGLAIMVGLSVVLSLRLLGWFDGVPLKPLLRLLKVAWIALIVNTLSGGSLFMYQGTTYVTKGIFLTKLAMVLIGAVLVAVMQVKTTAALAAGAGTIGSGPLQLKILAWAVIVAWTIAMVTGRFIAYL